MLSADTFTQSDTCQNVISFCCFRDQMALVAEGSILTGFYYSNIKIERGIASLTAPEYKKLYREEEAYKDITEFEYVSPNCYDATWGIALALNCTHNVLNQTGNLSLVRHTFL